jgi:hypothetical protein
MKRTGSSGSCVGPAVINTVSPSRSRRCGLPGDGLGDFFRLRQPARAGHAASQIAAPGSIDSVAAAQRFDVGPGGGCCHMLTFMAGASTTGPVKARYNVVRKIIRPGRAPVWRSDRRWPARSPADRAPGRPMCSIAFSMANRSVSVLRPVSAANVSGGRILRGVRHHRLHFVALLHQQARQLGGLVCRDAAADAENNLHKFSPRTDRSLRSWLR